MKLEEMAYTKDEAISRCNALGKQFVKNFGKTYKGGANADTFHHHCHEMQTLFDDVKSIKLKMNKKPIPIDYIFDCFLTIGQNIEDLFDSDELRDAYGVFVGKLLGYGNVDKAMIDTIQMKYEKDDDI